ncbi:MAG: hypothetical protein WAU29_16345 [Chitinophagaceae bacterium]
MTKFTAFVLIVAMRIMYHPSPAQHDIAPFASPSPLPTATTAIPAKLISIAGTISNNKFILNWEVGDNETADQFEVEKSTDGKNFTMAALVFGTDKSATDKYQFYEKAGNQRVLYRIKLINKNRQTEYSTVIEINPNV